LLGRLAVGGFPDHLDVLAFEQLAHQGAKLRPIVDEQYADAHCGPFPLVVPSLLTRERRQQPAHI
jgi:hypothetical protein